MQNYKCMHEGNKVNKKVNLANWALEHLKVPERNVSILQFLHNWLPYFSLKLVVHLLPNVNFKIFVNPTLLSCDNKAFLFMMYCSKDTRTMQFSL